MGYRERYGIPNLGVGVGFRGPHHEKVLSELPPMDWFEIIAENYMLEAPIPTAKLEKLRAHYPVVSHGVSMSIGGADPLDEAYLALLERLIRRIRPPWCSDHLCWTGVANVDVHDLLPMPYTRAALEHVVERVKRVQDRLGIPFALENVSSYLTYQASAMPEWEFLAEVADRADCGILLDVNNVFVSAYNHGFDAEQYVDAIDADRVVQIHVAGHSSAGTHLLDTHSAPVRDEVWALYRRVLARTGPTSTLVEWDEDIPEWDVLAGEAARARAIAQDVLGGERGL